MTIYYVVQRLCSFEQSIEVDGYPWAVVRLDWPKDGDSPKSFLPVFETREAAESWSEDGKYPIRKIVTIEQEYIEEPVN